MSADENTYWYLGQPRQALPVRWYCVPAGFIVRRHTRNGYISGHLTNRGGWGKPHLAEVFATAEAAALAAHKTRVRFFEVLHNVPEGKVKANSQPVKRFAVMEAVPVICKATSAFKGEILYERSRHTTMDEAEMEATKYTDPECRVYVQEYPEHQPALTADCPF